VVRRELGKLNDALKSQLPKSYRDLNERYADLVGTRNELNLKLGAESEKGGALMKRVFSPSDANTKKLFAKVHEVTGIDLVHEATLAKYVMELLGDARQKSLLEQLNLRSTHSHFAPGIAHQCDAGVFDSAGHSSRSDRKRADRSGVSRRASDGPSSQVRIGISAVRSGRLSAPG
jgi:hypothetical protein